MKKFKLLDISTWFEQGGMISVKKGDETLNYQIDEDNQSIEVDKATRDYLVDIALVTAREFKKLKDTYIFYIQDLSDEDIVELEEIFECYIPVRMSDRWDGEMAHGGMMGKFRKFAKGGMIEESDIIEGAKFKIKSGIVFIVDEIEDDPEFGKISPLKYGRWLKRQLS